MKRKNIIPELIYYISNYEKCRVDMSAYWGKKYITSLIDSLDIISMLIVVLIGKGNNDIINSINNFLIKQDGVIVSNASLLFVENNYDFLREEIFFSECEKAVIELMISIINECRRIVFKKTGEYKKTVSYLLKALHNLPRALLEENSCSSIQHISCETALEYAKSYFKHLSINF